MERAEAAATGLEVRDLQAEVDYPRLLEQAGGNSLEAGAARVAQLLRVCSVRGRTALYGKADVGLYSAYVDRLRRLAPEIEFVGEDPLASTLLQARTTKSPDEVERIRSMGAVTVAVAGELLEFLQSHRERNGILVGRDSEPLTVGQVKRKVELWLAERGAENTEGLIFSQGRESGIPHSTGTDSHPVRTGTTTILDLFPQEAGGGYFYDFTRTWCLGFAPDEALEVYEDVWEGYRKVAADLRPDAFCRDYQIAMCAFFRARGHPTLVEDRAAQEGYVHGLGHGVGLDIHESPRLSHEPTNMQRLLPGSVFTFEPGLYYPGRGLGVRIENTLWARPGGGIEPLAEFPEDLVWKLKRRAARARRPSRRRSSP
jgi:Xaa-Pro aminopeptidase